MCSDAQHFKKNPSVTCVRRHSTLKKSECHVCSEAQHYKKSECHLCSEAQHYYLRKTLNNIDKKDDFSIATQTLYAFNT